VVKPVRAPCSHATSARSGVSAYPTSRALTCARGGSHVVSSEEHAPECVVALRRRHRALLGLVRNHRARPDRREL